MEGVRQRFLDLSQVQNITLSYELPDGNNSGYLSIYREGSDSLTAMPSQLLMTDEYYAETYSIPMVAGEFYQRKGGRPDSSRIVINETQARALGFGDIQSAIGQRVRLQGWGQVFTIAGVIKDFHFSSMQQAIQPAVFVHLGLTNTFRFFSIKLKPGNINQSISALQKYWNALLPGTSFEYKFMDQILNNLYKTEIQLKQAAYLATLLALIIALLGVLGLVSMSIRKKTKEIGIRKVLGSSFIGIINLFIKEYLPVVCIAGFVACPLAWYLLEQWLSGYAYRIKISALPFIYSLTGLTFLTVILIALQSIKSSLENPMKALRSE